MTDLLIGIGCLISGYLCITFAQDLAMGISNGIISALPQDIIMFYVKEIIAVILFVPVCLLLGLTLMANALLVGVEEVYEMINGER